MPTIDFITAFGRLLRDASLRHAFANDPLGTAESLGLLMEERPAWLALDQNDLEFQAEILLRKRFEAASRLIPQTIANTGAHAWSLFVESAGNVWPSGDPAELDDANRFCAYLASVRSAFVNAAERNRLRFATGEALVAFHFVSDALIRQRLRPCLQIFIRTTDRAWRELRIYLG